MANLKDLKTKFEKRFFSRRKVEELQATKDMWNFIENAVQDERRKTMKTIDEIKDKIYWLGYDKAIKDINKNKISEEDEE